MANLVFQDVKTNGISLRCAVAGPDDGPLVLLLHGFPECWWTWRRLFEPLSAAGYRVVAPDQRGYGASDKPQRVAPYSKDELAKDVIGLIDAFGRDKASVVAHDWGAIVGWWLADQHPERLERVVLMNVPHPTVFSAHLKSPKQLLKSSYAFFFQLPWLPELILRAGQFRFFRRNLPRSAKPGAYTDLDLERYVESWSPPGALTGMLNWYRAAGRVPTAPLRHEKIPVPLLLIWGANDPALSLDMARPSIDHCQQGRLEIVGDAAHFVQHDAPDRVEAWVLEHLGSGLLTGRLHQ
jgi:pimeloyl-ACP methyl ester carboxylesterase